MTNSTTKLTLTKSLFAIGAVAAALFITVPAQAGAMGPSPLKINSQQADGSLIVNVHSRRGHGYRRQGGHRNQHYRGHRNNRNHGYRRHGPRGHHYRRHGGYGPRYNRYNGFRFGRGYGHGGYLQFRW